MDPTNLETEKWDAAKHAEAFRVALDIRKFEIEHYWKRAACFWTFIAISLAGYAAMLTAGLIKRSHIGGVAERCRSRSRRYIVRRGPSTRLRREISSSAAFLALLTAPVFADESPENAKQQNAEPFKLTCTVTGNEQLYDLVLNVDPNLGRVNGSEAMIDEGQIVWTYGSVNRRYRAVVNRYTGGIHIYALTLPPSESTGYCKLVGVPKF